MAAPAPLPTGLYDHRHSRAQTTTCAPRWTALAALLTPDHAMGPVEVSSWFSVAVTLLLRGSAPA
jgi:hypothetical protein